MRRAFTALCLVAVLADRAAAQPTAPVEEAEATVVEDLVVRPLTPGPAWWRVSDADSAVYILIVPGVAPAGMAWDKSVLERRLDGAERLILPFDFSLFDPRSVVGMAGILAQAPKVVLARPPRRAPKDPAAPPLEETLPPDLRARFVAMRERIGRPAERYARMTPVQATNVINGDYRTYSRLVDGEVLKSIEASARRRRLKTEAAYKPVIRLGRLDVVATGEPPFDQGVACLAAGLERMTARVEAERRAAQAWTEGDVRPLLRPGRPGDPACVGRGLRITVNGPLLRRFEEEFVRDQVAVLERALRRPGHTVAVLEPLSPFGPDALALLSPNGVLDRLRAKGYVVDSPASLEND